MASGERALFVWMVGAAFRAQPGRWVVAGVTVAIGLALAVSIHVVNRSALGEFGRALDVVNGQSSAQIQAPAGDFDESLFEQIDSVANNLGIESVSPVLVVRTELLTVIGLDLFRAARVTPSLMPSVEQGQRDDLFAADSIFLSAAALRELGVSVGDRITLKAGLRAHEFRVAGSVPGAAGQSIAVMDIGLVQWRFDRLGKLSRLDLRLLDGANGQSVSASLASIAPGLTLVLADDRDRRMSNLSRAYRVNLSVLALVALFTGAFLVFTTVTFSVLRQQTQLALLGVLGASPRWIVLLVQGQAVLVCAAGGALGIAAGLGLAKILLILVGGDLGAGYFSKTVPPLEFSWWAMLGFWLLSVLVGVLAGWFPAQRASSNTPIEQLRLGAAERLLAPLARPWLAIALAVLSLGLAFAPAVDGLPIAGYASIGCVLFAGVALLPWLVKGVFEGVARVLAKCSQVNSSVLFAIWRIAQAPASAAGLIAGVVAAISLTVAMVIMVASFRDSVARWLDQILPADLYTSSQGMANSSGFDENAQRVVATLPGVARYEFNRHQPVLVRPDWPEVMVMARPLPRDNPSEGVPLTGPLIDTGARPVVFASEAMRDLYGWQPGGVYSLALSSNAPAVRLHVAGIYRDYGRQHGSIMMDIADFSAITGDDRKTALALWLAPNAKPEQVVEQLRREIPAMRDLRVMSAQDIRALSLRIFDRSFALTYALELAALVVAVFSVATGFAGQALIRSKEFALMAHLGQSRGQTRGVIAIESLALLGLGVAWGSVLGFAMSQVLIHRVNPQSFHWTMESAIPFVPMLLLAIAVIMIGAVSALWAAGRGLAPARLSLALREDW
jgi:putative ABC transport system permease protein